MNKTLLLCFLLFSSSSLYSKVLLPEGESRSLDEAMSVVEKSQKDRKEFEDDKTKREMASEKKNDPKFDKAFDELMDDLDQK